MMNRNVILNICAAASLALAPISFAETVTDGSHNRNHVAGEKLDSGLGDLRSDYDAAEYNVTHVAGEKLDSGLGELSQDYDAAEYNDAANLHVGNLSVRADR
jgi:hypothetical protein